MELILECTGCGGAVVYDANREQAACVFCGAEALDRQEVEEPAEVPDGILPQEVTLAAAQEEYRAWARSSWWHPEEMRNLSVDLQLLLIPAWRFEGDVESHWNGLESAVTKSGKRPVGGSDEARLVHMLPASQGISAAELTELEPFYIEKVQPWVGVGEEAPYELPGLTEQAARSQMHSLMSDVHVQVIAARHRLLSCVASSLVQNETVQLLVLPVFIGAFRFRDRPWRFVVNAQTGEVVGDAPVDRMKVLAVTLGTVVALGLLGAIFSEM
ncbi:MAG: hypothetical protein VX519_11425 [Myxococcota bacterium]|nr:hypothetical protein [Myxococcota bacterium]